MSKITPTSVLPYIKSYTPVNSNTRAINTSNALSASTEKSKDITKDIFGLISGTVAYYEKVRTPEFAINEQLSNSGQPAPVNLLSAVVSAWQKR